MPSKTMIAQKKRIRRSWRLAIAAVTSVVKRRRAAADAIQITTTR